MGAIISVEGLGKKYRIRHGQQAGGVGQKTFRDLLSALPRKFKARLANPAQAGAGMEDFWALKDVSFDVQPGDRVGIIGRNGAGKSTLLKLLSRITEPSVGKITLRGRLASLLEVGTGFHPELTGRENIFLNGAILGMSRAEVTRKFDEIVDFSGVEKFLDTPVKRYSSGMYVRLAFAVAAHLEPEILVVDEVLAVGDAEFQKKCLGKMEEVGREGRTVLFVSHNMGAVQQLCTHGILLEGGTIREIADAASTVATYFAERQGVSGRSVDYDAYGDEYVKLLDFSVVGESQQKQEHIYTKDKIGFKFSYRIINKGMFPDLSIVLSAGTGEYVLHAFSNAKSYEIGDHAYVVWVPAGLLNSIDYVLSLGITTIQPRVAHFLFQHPFRVLEGVGVPEDANYKGPFLGVVRPNIEWVNI